MRGDFSISSRRANARPDRATDVLGSLRPAIQIFIAPARNLKHGIKAVFSFLRVGRGEAAAYLIFQSEDFSRVNGDSVALKIEANTASPSTPCPVTPNTLQEHTGRTRGCQLVSPALACSVSCNYWIARANLIDYGWQVGARPWAHLATEANLSCSPSSIPNHAC